MYLIIACFAAFVLSILQSSVNNLADFQEVTRTNRKSGWINTVVVSALLGLLYWTVDPTDFEIEFVWGFLTVMGIMWVMVVWTYKPSPYPETMM